MSKLRVYLDNCCFNRPYDDQEQKKIMLETEAKLKIQGKIKEGKLELVWSYMLDFENSANPNETVRSLIAEWKQLSIVTIVETMELIKNATDFNRQGIDAKDALHLACALEGKADLFFTTDTDIIKRADAIREMKVLNPVHFFIEHSTTEVTP